MRLAMAILLLYSVAGQCPVVDAFDATASGTADGVTVVMLMSLPVPIAAISNISALIKTGIPW